MHRPAVVRRVAAIAAALSLALTPALASAASEPHDVAVLEGFQTLVDEYPAVLDDNLALTLRINRGASEAESAGAEVDDRTDAERTVASGFGTRLGAIYLAHLGDGSLPLTTALLAKAAESTEPAKQRFHYPRPFLAAGFTDAGHSDGVVPRMGKDRYADLAESGSFPSGHTSTAFIAAITLGLLVPETGATLLDRAEEAGYHRIVLGVHYPLDVIGGRMHAEAVIADRLGDAGFRADVAAAATELRGVLEHDCGNTVAACVADDTVARPERPGAGLLDAEFATIGTPGLDADVPEGAQRLLSARFPNLTDQQREQVLAITQTASGKPLDIQDGSGSWQRINLIAAMRAEVSVDGDTVTVNPLPPTERGDRSVLIAVSIVGGVVVLGIAVLLVVGARRRRAKPRAV